MVIETNEYKPVRYLEDTIEINSFHALKGKGFEGLNYTHTITHKHTNR